MTHTKRFWDWSKISESELTTLKIPEGFLWGQRLQNINFQVQKLSYNNWTRWEIYKNKNKQSAIKNNQKSGISADHWNRYKEDIQLMKDLGLNSYRFQLNGVKLSQKKDDSN